VEVVRDLNNAARFSSLTVTEDGALVVVQSAGCGIGRLAAGGLAWDFKSAAWILSAGVIGDSNKSSATVLEEIRTKTSLVLHIPLMLSAVRSNWNAA
jgi:hypothetical protein